jgi:hypothetical protein
MHSKSGNQATKKSWPAIMGGQQLRRSGTDGVQRTDAGCVYMYKPCRRKLGIKQLESR